MFLSGHLMIVATMRVFADLSMNVREIRTVLQKKIAPRTIVAQIMDTAELVLNTVMTNTIAKLTMIAILMNVAPNMVIVELDQNIVVKKQLSPHYRPVTIRLINLNHD